MLVFDARSQIRRLYFKIGIPIDNPLQSTFLAEVAQRSGRTRFCTRQGGMPRKGKEKAEEPPDQPPPKLTFADHVAAAEAFVQVSWGASSVVLSLLMNICLDGHAGWRDIIVRAGS
jgi:hypothetical protein